MASDIPDLTNLSAYNFNYQYTGEPSIAPSKVFDNGQFTYFQFSRVNAEIPAIFSVDNSGFEALVNYRVAGNFIIVEKVGEQFTLRSGDDIVCVYNSTLFAKSVVNPYNKGKKNKNPVRPNNFAPARSQISPSNRAPSQGGFSYPSPAQTNPIAPNLPGGNLSGFPGRPRGSSSAPRPKGL